MHSKMPSIAPLDFIYYFYLIAVLRAMAIEVEEKEEEEELPELLELIDELESSEDLPGLLLKIGRRLRLTPKDRDLLSAVAKLRNSK